MDNDQHSRQFSSQKKVCIDIKTRSGTWLESELVWESLWIIDMRGAGIIPASLEFEDSC